MKKLQSFHRNQLLKKDRSECELLSKIRGYCKHRIDLEQQYAQGLKAAQKLFSWTSDSSSEYPKQARTVFAAWNQYLDDVAQTGSAHESLKQVYNKQIYSSLKTLQDWKTTTSKKVFNTLTNLHNELQRSQKEFDKCKSDFVVQQNALSEAEAKFQNATVRLRKGGHSLLKIKESTDKDAEKLTSKVEKLQQNVSNSSNIYAIERAGLQSHVNHYVFEEFPQLVAVANGDFHDQLLLIVKSMNKFNQDKEETVTCYTQSAANKLSEPIPYQENMERFLKSCFVDDKVLMESYSADNENITELTLDTTDESFFRHELHKCRDAIQRNEQIINGSKVKISQLDKFRSYLSGATTPGERKSFTDSSTSSGNDDKEIARAIDEAKIVQRKAENDLMKANARINFIKNSGVDVDKLLASPSGMRESPKASPSGSGASVTSGHESVAVGDSATSSRHVPKYQDPAKHTMQPNTSAVGTFPRHYQALYDYQAVRSDELSLTQGDIVTLYEDPGAVAWPTAENSEGDVGVVPSNYIEEYVGPMEHTPHSSQGGYTDDVFTQEGVPAATKRHHHFLPIPTDPPPDKEVVTYCQASLPYEAHEGQDDDEISFNPGDIIMVTDKRPSGTDDGWWKGYHIPSRLTGTFPSMLCAEIDKSALKITSEVLNGSKTLSSSVNPLLQTSTESDTTREERSWSYCSRSEDV